VDPDIGPLDPADEGTMILCNAGNYEYTYTQRHSVTSQEKETFNTYVLNMNWHRILQYAVGFVLLRSVPSKHSYT